MPRITVNLQTDESKALIQLANYKRRDPREQAAYLLRRSLEAEGYLKSEKGMSEASNENQTIK